MKKIDASLIISVYKNINALKLILKSLEIQSFTNFEIIIAEDNDSEEMSDFVSTYKVNSNLKITHIKQKDDGFRKNIALNKSIALTQSDYIIFIDGDCVLHKHFIKEHFENRTPNKFLVGRRVMLSEKLTTKLYNTLDLELLNILNLYLSRSKRVEEGFYLPFLETSKHIGICGSNWSVAKQDLIDINGFDEDYSKPGFGEDTDIEKRLQLKGLTFKKVKNKAIQYHLHHTVNYNDTNEMMNLMNMKLKNGNFYCQNGIDKYLPH